MCPQTDVFAGICSNFRALHKVEIKMCVFQMAADTGNLQVQFGYSYDMNRNANPMNKYTRAHHGTYYKPEAPALIIVYEMI